MKKFFKRALLIAIAIFIIYNLISFHNAPESSVIAQIGTIEESHSFDGIIFRDEYTVDTTVESEGVLDPTVDEYEMVKKGKHIATYYDKSIDENTKNRLSAINKRLAEINATPDSKSIERINREEIENQIINDLRLIPDVASERQMSKVSAIQADIENLLGQRELAEKEGDSTENILEDLKAEKRRLERNYKGEKTEITSPSHGLFSTHLDGFEDILNKEKALSLSVSDFESLKKKEVSPEDAIKGGVVCKIMDNSVWWVSVLATESQAKCFKLGEKILIRIGDEECEGKIEYISSPKNGQYVITASSIDFSKFVVENRFAKVTFVENSYTGLIVPVKCIRVKDGTQGVYVRTENTVKYRKADIIYKNDKDAVIKLDNSEPGSLKLYDEVLITMKEKDEV